jgi:hypothetical protein
MPGSIGPRKYAPLTAYLAARPVDEVTLAEIEQIIGAPLPKSASQASFWTNRRKGLSEDRPWVAAGWRVAGVAMRTAAPTVTFARITFDATAAPSAPLAYPRP